MDQILTSNNWLFLDYAYAKTWTIYSHASFLQHKMENWLDIILMQSKIKREFYIFLEKDTYNFYLKNPVEVYTLEFGSTFESSH